MRLKIENQFILMYRVIFAYTVCLCLLRYFIINKQ
nr:CPPV089 hypothetical protein [Cooks petrelpox virus]